MAITRRTPRSILREEVIDKRVTELLDRVNSLAGNALESGVVDRPAGHLRTPDFSHLIRNDLKSYFEDEVILAIPESDGGSIDAIELDHELAKKALVGLKLSRLKEGAKEIGAPLTGAKTSEEVAAAVARTLNWDSAAVAKFILEHEEEPSESNAAHGARVYPLEADRIHTAETINAAVQTLVGRYIRVGVARWYVFDDVNFVGETTNVSGTFMWYTAEVDPTKDHAALHSVPRSDSVTASIVPYRNVIEVGNVSVRTAKAAVYALTSALLQPKLGYIPHTGSGSERVDGTVHGTVEFLLSILQDRLPRAGVLSVNPTVARFKFDSTEDSTDANRPHLKAVRFEGSHILDSVPACQLIVSEGRPLAAISFRMILDVSEEDLGKSFSSFPVKISLEGDHVQVVTGLGDDPINSNRAYEIVRDAVLAEIEEGRPDYSSLDQLVERITERAVTGESSEKASILELRRNDAGGYE